ncbi:MAG: DNA topoisomerase IV subunit A [Candidatus Brockarchaeota archaeon]|nr:DNA topoisomerase IV subunit A [Candidatus Brockarchaeota archaeon]
MAKKRKILKGVSQARKKDSQEALKALAEGIIDQIRKADFPSVTMPSRTTDNIYFDKKLKQYVLGGKVVRRTARNVTHLKPLTQLVWAGYIASTLLKENKTSTLRDVFYMAEGEGLAFEDQPESDRIITELESVIKHPREDFNIFPEERSAMFGNLEVEYTVPGYEGRRLNFTMNPDGIVIGPAVATSEFVDTDADKVIVIEKGAMFTRFVEEKAWKRYNALLIYTAGQAPRATRAIIRRLNVELKLPVYLFADADPWGLHICQVIISGSANAAHIPELVTPSAKWAGVYASDIVKYDLPSTKLNEQDIKRLQEIGKDPRYQSEPWKTEINKFFEIKKKAEQEAFSRYGLSFIVDKYLKSRLEELEG